MRYEVNVILKQLLDKEINRSKAASDLFNLFGEEKGKVKKHSKWYAVPPYKGGENWKVLNDKGEIVAWFETQEDCEKAVMCYNEKIYKVN